MDGNLAVTVTLAGADGRPLGALLRIDLASQGSDPDDVRRNVQRKVEQLVDEFFARLRDREGVCCEGPG